MTSASAGAAAGEATAGRPGGGLGGSQRLAWQTPSGVRAVQSSSK